jgi:hypothetical protein
VVVGTSADLAGSRSADGVACADPYFNDLRQIGRAAACARLHFVDDQLDNDSLQALLRLLEETAGPRTTLDQRWAPLSPSSPANPNSPPPSPIRRHPDRRTLEVDRGDRATSERFLPDRRPASAVGRPGEAATLKGDRLASSLSDNVPPDNLPPDNVLSDNVLSDNVLSERRAARQRAARQRGTPRLARDRLGAWPRRQPPPSGPRNSAGVDAFPADQDEPSGPLDGELAAPSLLPACALLGIDIVRLLTSVVAFDDRFLRGPSRRQSGSRFRRHCPRARRSTNPAPSLSSAAVSSLSFPVARYTYGPMHFSGRRDWWGHSVCRLARLPLMPRISSSRIAQRPAARGVRPSVPIDSPVSLDQPTIPGIVCSAAAERSIAADRLSDRPVAILRMPRVDEVVPGPVFPVCTHDRAGDRAASARRGPQLDRIARNSAFHALAFHALAFDALAYPPATAFQEIHHAYPHVAQAMPVGCSKPTDTRSCSTRS